MKEHFKALREYNGMRKDNRLKLNTDIMEKSGIAYWISGNGTFIIRGEINVDFYPSTGRWRCIKGKAMKGGANAFIKWYTKQLSEVKK